MALRIFISYTHDTKEQMDRVWDLSERLRGDGVDCRIDQHEESPAEGWPRWCRTQVQESQFVLIVCTETYQRRYEGREEPGKGLGGKWEGFVITQGLYVVEGRNTKFIPVVFSSADNQFIPTELRGVTYYNLGAEDGYEKLFLRLAGQPERIPTSIVSQVRAMPSQDSESALKQVFTVPFSENPVFTGREDVFQRLKITLAANGLATLNGVGGIGKTQMAVQYSYAHRRDYEAVLWARANSQETLFADLSDLAERLELPEHEAKEQRVTVDAVKRWLDQHLSWLLILDDVQDFEMIGDLAAKADAKGRHVIITTRLQAPEGTARPSLSSMDKEQGALLLLRRANRLPANGSLAGAERKDVELAEQISEELGGLPLALNQAGAYIEHTGCGLEHYLMLLGKPSTDLLDGRGGLGLDRPSLAETVLTSFGRLTKQNRAAAELLQAVAFLATDAIPEEIFTEGAAQFGPLLQATAADPDKWNEAVGAAVNFSLLERSPAQKFLAVHRLVQAVMKSRMSSEERKVWAEQVVQAVNAVFPYVEAAVWDKCERLVASAQACTSLVEKYDLFSPDASRLLNQAGYYLRQRARYAEAEPLHRQVLAIDERLYGPYHPNVAVDLNNLAQLLFATNRLDEAEPVMRRAVQIFERADGLDHPNVATSINNVAAMLLQTNRLMEAEPLLRRALTINERSYGPDHPNVARDLNNLALVMRMTNRLGEAERLMRRALAIDDRSFGSDHPDVARDLNNLARLLQDMGRASEAEVLYRRALYINEKTLGHNHPSVPDNINNLAVLYAGEGRYEEAEPLFLRALAIQEANFGKDHPKVGALLRNYASLLKLTNRQDEAAKITERMS